jgi:hypothetical protein
MQFTSEPQPDRRAATSGKRGPDCQRLSERLFTIGHSNHSIERFLELLRQAEVTAVADVRSSPFSQRYPQFNQPALEQELEKSGIRYLFLGDELGGRPRDPAVYDDEGRVDYGRVRCTSWFRNGLDRLLMELDQQPVAMMCAEEDPLDCHRALMVCAELVEQGIRPRHVRGAGWIDTTEELEDRLLDITGEGGGMIGGLFDATISPEERADMLAKAYKAQARRKAFRLPPGQGFAAIDSFQEYATE